MRTHVLLENLHALPELLERYALEERDRVRVRTIELLHGGLARDRHAVIPAPMPLASTEADGARPIPGCHNPPDQRTRLSRRLGDRIAAAMEVTKGSCYHHLDAKDNLVHASLRRSLDVILRAQNLASDRGSDRLQHLALLLITLIDVQLSDRTPLLHMTALTALPIKFRRDIVNRTKQITRRFAGMLMEGVTEGTIAPIDPLVGGHMLKAALNVAYELRNLTTMPADGQAVTL
jgi:AcrR family transcriptional regulator